eukprot:scaffold519099_cov19-Prasinocladus_malaysianus.AAC.1
MAKLLLLALYLSVWTCPPPNELFPRTALPKASKEEKLLGQLFRTIFVYFASLWYCLTKWLLA